jgi:hypothetical protein
VFVTPEKDIKLDDDDPDDFDNVPLMEWINKLSFETKFKSKMYTEGKVDDREWSSSKGSFMSGRAWCKEQCFDPSRGFADEGWGFEEGEEAEGIMDWERRHLASVSKKHGLQTVFISNGRHANGGVVDGLHQNEIMVQVARPAWYPYDGPEAPLGTFVYTSNDEGPTRTTRMVPAEEANEVGIARDKDRRGEALTVEEEALVSVRTARTNAHCEHKTYSQGDDDDGELDPDDLDVGLWNSF